MRCMMNSNAVQLCLSWTLSVLSSHNHSAATAAKPTVIVAHSLTMPSNHITTGQARPFEGPEIGRKEGL